MTLSVSLLSSFVNLLGSQLAGAEVPVPENSGAKFKTGLISVEGGYTSHDFGNNQSSNHDGPQFTARASIGRWCPTSICVSPFFTVSHSVVTATQKFPVGPALHSQGDITRFGIGPSVTWAPTPAVWFYIEGNVALLNLAHLHAKGDGTGNEGLAVNNSPAAASINEFEIQAPYVSLAMCFAPSWLSTPGGGLRSCPNVQVSHDAWDFTSEWFPKQGQQPVEGVNWTFNFANLTLAFESSPSSGSGSAGAGPAGAGGATPAPSELTDLEGMVTPLRDSNAAADADVRRAERSLADCRAATTATVAESAANEAIKAARRVTNSNQTAQSQRLPAATRRAALNSTPFKSRADTARDQITQLITEICEKAGKAFQAAKNAKETYDHKAGADPTKVVFTDPDPRPCNP